MVPTDPCSACSQSTLSQSKSGKRGKAGKGGGCSPTEKLIQVEIVTDRWPEETFWYVTRDIEYEMGTYTSTTPVLEGGPYDAALEYITIQESACVPEGQYRFTIFVSDLQYICICCLCLHCHCFLCTTFYPVMPCIDVVHTSHTLSTNLIFNLPFS